MPENRRQRKASRSYKPPQGTIEANKVYDFRQFIAALGISRATGHRLIARGPRNGGIAVARAGSRVLITGAAILDFLNRNQRLVA